MKCIGSFDGGEGLATSPKRPALRQHFQRIFQVLNNFFYNNIQRYNKIIMMILIIKMIIIILIMKMKIMITIVIIMMMI